MILLKKIASHITSSRTIKFMLATFWISMTLAALYMFLQRQHARWHLSESLEQHQENLERLEALEREKDELKESVDEQKIEIQLLREEIESLKE